MTACRWCSLGLLLAALASAWVPEGAVARDHDGWHERHGRENHGGMRDARRGDRARSRESIRATPLPPMPAPQLPNLRVEPAPPVMLERLQLPPGVDRWGRPLRLSPDERRALRQQINDAGRDVYRPQLP